MTLAAAHRPSAGRAIDEPIRVSWRLSPDGTVAACTVSDPRHGALLEVRSGRNVRRHRMTGLSIHTQLIPVDDGSVLLCHHTDGRHLVEKCHSNGTVETLAVRDGQGLLVVAPAYPGQDLTAIERGRDGSTRVLRLGGDRTEVIAELAGVAVGAVWLERNRLAVNLSDSRSCDAVALDTVSGSTEPLLSISPTSEDRVIAYLAEHNLLVVSTTAAGTRRLGFGYPGENPIRFPKSLIGDDLQLLAIDAAGTQLALSLEDGARSRMLLFDIAAERLREIELPPLACLGKGHLNSDRLVVPVSTPNLPGTLLRIDFANRDRQTFDDHAAAATAVELRLIPCSTGDLEALVLGDPDTAETVVVALHGGPLEAWRAGYDPLLAHLAELGTAVVAPNVRGSVGYGRDHALAIRNAWGVSDLADVLAVLRYLRELRPQLARAVVLGVSYGAYLAVLAAAAAPDLTSRCLAVSPFISGRRVMDSKAPVAALVARLGGEDSPDLRDAGRGIRVPTLLVHGSLDDTVPAGESELLYRSLRSHAVPVQYHEITGGSHDLTAGRSRGQLFDLLTAFIPAATR